MSTWFSDKISLFGDITKQDILAGGSGEKILVENATRRSPHIRRRSYTILFSGYSMMPSATILDELANKLADDPSLIILSTANQSL